jgi:NADH-quinone oxidoreductase subunit N
MYYYLIVVKKMYINEPIDPSPVSISGPMKAVVYVGLAGTLVIGIYPQPFIDWIVGATLMFSNFATQSTNVILPTPPFGG